MGTAFRPLVVIAVLVLLLLYTSSVSAQVSHPADEIDFTDANIKMRGDHPKLTIVTNEDIGIQATGSDVGISSQASTTGIRGSGFYGIVGISTSGGGAAVKGTVTENSNSYSGLFTGGKGVMIEDGAFLLLNSGEFRVSGSSNDMVVDSEGRVGIGLSPKSNYHLSVGGNAEITGNLGVGASIEAAAITGGVVCDTNGNCLHGDGTGGDDGDWIISGNSMYSGVSGNVGIGASSPSHKLTVNGDIATTAFGNVYVSGDIEMLGSGGEIRKVDKIIFSDGTEQTTAVWVEDVLGNIYRESGKVAIGTTEEPAPDVKLYVDGSMIVSGDATFGDERADEVFIKGGGTVEHGLLIKSGGLQVHDDSSGSYDLVVDESSGNVGIGTAGNPDAKLHIAAPNDGGIFVDTVDNIRKAKIFFREGGSDSFGGIVGYDAGPDVLYLNTIQNGNEKIGIAIKRGSGRVGIGTSSPGAKLDVNGNLKVSGDATFGDERADEVFINGGGTVENGLLVKSGGLQVTGGNVDVSNDLNVDGNLNVDGKVYGWAVPSDIKITSSSHSGDFSGFDKYGNAKNGYQAVYNWIQGKGCSGYHVCDGIEITRYLQIHGELPIQFDKAWYNSGVFSFTQEGHDHATHDCEGWHGVDTYDRGSVWWNDYGGRDQPDDAMCSEGWGEKYPFLCCKY